MRFFVFCRGGGGPEGVGKTTVLIYVAHRLRDRSPDGVYFVPLGAPTVPKDGAGLVQMIMSRAVPLDRSRRAVGHEQVLEFVLASGEATGDA